MRFILTAFFLALVSSPAIAQTPLTDNQVSRFVATLGPIEAFGKELEADGKVNAFDDKNPALGKEFHPYANAVAAMKKDHPADYAKLGALVKPQGFTQDGWATTGDRVIIAYMAVRMERDNPNYAKQTPQMTPEMLERIPPASRAQIEAARAFIETVKNAPAADKVVVKPHVGEIEKATGAQ